MRNFLFNLLMPKDCVVLTQHEFDCICLDAMCFDGFELMYPLLSIEALEVLAFGDDHTDNIIPFPLTSKSR